MLATARLAAIAALKRTADWIPLCHPVRVVGTDVDLVLDRALPGVRVRVTVRAFDRTGVEMEAMVGAAAAALTIYDMVKGVERGVEIRAVRLEEKRGGKSGEWRRAAWRRQPATREMQSPSRHLFLIGEPQMSCPTRKGRHHRLRSGRLHGRDLRRARQPRPDPVRGRRRDHRADHAARRAADDHDRGRELPRLSQGRPGPGADGAVQGAGRALRHAHRHRRRDRGRSVDSGRSA